MSLAAPYPETLSLLAQLVAFDSTSAKSNLALIDHIDGYLTGLGYELHRIPSENGEKAGLMARRGTGGVMLSAHSDVVPVTGQNWSRPPFELTQEDGRLYGRGTTDMKGFLASMLSAARRAAEQNLPLMLAISYDEEVGCTGIREMLPAIQALQWQPKLCVVGEPTSLRPAIGHKGKAAFRATFTGLTGHSAIAPNYVNALHLAAEFIAILRQLQWEYASSGAQDRAYDIPYSTVHAGKMQGGTALNIVPDQAQVEFEFRHLPQDTLEDFLTRLNEQVTLMLRPYRQLSEHVAAEIIMTNCYPGLDCAPDSDAVALLCAATGANGTTKVAYGTEAGYFTALGIETLVCGPGDMSAQGHKADEYLDLSELAACDVFLDRLIAQK